MSTRATGVIPKNSAIRQARERWAGALVPSHVLLEVTYRCNLRCVHCYVEPPMREKQPVDLPTSAWMGILEQLIDIGVWHVTFTGGEALCRPDIFEIMEYARDKGIFFNLKTNGTLITEPVADRLRELGLTGADVSLYGATRETHEYVTGIAGSYDRTIRALNMLRERKIRTSIKSVMMRCNVTEHEGIDKIAGDLGAAYNPDLLIFPKVGHPDSNADIRMSDEQLRSFCIKRNFAIDEAEAREPHLDRHLICTAGRVRCAISPEGEVFPCTLWRLPLGNLKQQGFRDIWYGEAADRLRAIKASDIRPCTDCELVGYCYRCPGLAHMLNGGISGPSSENCRLAHIVKGVIDGDE